MFGSRSLRIMLAHFDLRGRIACIRLGKQVRVDVRRLARRLGGRKLPRERTEQYPNKLDPNKLRASGFHGILDRR
jgi:hypothetical protein